MVVSVVVAKMMAVVLGSIAMLDESPIHPTVVEQVSTYRRRRIRCHWRYSFPAAVVLVVVAHLLHLSFFETESFHQFVLQVSPKHEIK